MAAVVEDDEGPDRENRDDERGDRAERPGHGDRPVGEDPAGRQPGSRRRQLRRAPPGGPLELLEGVSFNHDAHRAPGTLRTHWTTISPIMAEGSPPKQDPPRTMIVGPRRRKKRVQ